MLGERLFKSAQQHASTNDFLNQALFDNAFRRGVSAFRFGLIPQGASDHLPISAKIETTEKMTFSLVSWNLLADDHLYNNFMNITGTKELFSAIQEISNTNIYCVNGDEQQNKLYHYFSELAHFLYENKTDSTINFNKDLLKKFNDITSFDLYPSRLARSRTKEVEEKNKIAVINSRQKIGEILLDSSHPNHHEFRLAAQHSLELYHHIKYGALKWENRFSIIKNNKNLIAALQKTDFLCFQECTEPEDFRKIPISQDWITHKISNATNDHCVLAYNQQKFKLINTTKGALEGNKPFILGKFENIETHERVIIGSIHHPGGNHQSMNELLEAVETLRQPPDQAIDFFMAGDYNHTREYFNDDRCAMHYPKVGTMAGSDYNNMNKAIDAVLTSSASCCRVHVDRVAELPPVAPIDPAPVKVHFYKNARLSEYASPSFWKPVQRKILLHDIVRNKLIETFGASSAVFAPRITL